MTPTFTNVSPVLVVEQVECADARHHERPGYHRADHVMQVHPESPGIQDQAPVAGESDLAVCAKSVTHGVLHPGVGGDDEVAGQPRAEEDGERGPPVAHPAEQFFSVEEQAQKTGFQKESEHAFHRQRLSDDAAGGPGKPAPVGSELKLHGDAGDHAHGEVDAENLCPETGGAVVVLVARAQGHRLQDHDQQRQPHRQLREQIVIRDREGEMKAVQTERGVHCVPAP
jgi:hypothetical protein